MTLTAGGARHVFTGEADVVLGRDPGCDVRVADDRRRVSRRHCRLTIRPAEVTVRDLGSRNGTYVNGVRADGERPLHDGDELRLGDAYVLVRVAIGGLALLRELGRGAQGVVHLAREPGGELVAVKTLTAPGATELFRRELDCTAALRHPNIVRFHRSLAEPLGFVAEYCAGGSVADHGPYGVDVALDLTRQAAAALRHAHTAEVPVVHADGASAVGRGLVHRDIKPQNLLLTADGRLKVGDFGLAKAYDQAGLSGRTPTGAIAGSVAFMPRRQVIDYKYAGPEVDRWALAACLYWMLTGATPRDFPAGADPVAVVLREPPTPVRERLPSLPAALAAAVDAALNESQIEGNNFDQLQDQLFAG
ncbi:protein kinase domain-containing protein [Paractinoplanes brasiliensis]|uniref:FHA domain-containing protein n=1 Tax=Paractinoplanes brasiliensis TaxID=52695 RepID=A0A4R6JS62_9ACTN|nr:FHA domain-containing serine/threonine-protein kinase [Actinoplanes brasiliensis]TDO37475.1 FHA domain-containing protein [Actinoplanes brasiliensis]